MATQLQLTLSELAEVAEKPLQQKSLWALLKLTGLAVDTGTGVSEGLQITPESILLRPGGRVEVVPGISDHPQFAAPELLLGSDLQRRQQEKALVYSLGASLLSVADIADEGALHGLLTTMVAEEPANRPSLKKVLTACAHLTKEEAEAEADLLVSLVLGGADYESSEEEVHLRAEDLGSELHAALQVMDGAKKNSTFSLSEKSISPRLSTSSIPPSYHLSLMEGLDTPSPQLLPRALSLTLSSHEIDLLARKTSHQRRVLPPDPSGIQKSASFSEESRRIILGSQSPPSSVPSPPTSPSPSSPEQSPPPSPISSPPHITVHPEDSHLLPNNAFQPTEYFPPLPPSPLLSVPAVESSAASFDNSGLENYTLSKTSSVCSTEEEFEVLPTVLPNTLGDISEQVATETNRAVDEALQEMDATNWDSAKDEKQGSGKLKRKSLHEEEDVSALYATVDKSKKTRRRAGRADWEEICGELGNERPPLPLPLEEEPTWSNRSSGVYEEVEARSVQVLDSSGYTEVVRERGFAQSLEVGYSGTGSISKLRNMLGPEFSNMTGSRSEQASSTLPDGRKAVEVVLLNGKAVEFVVSVSAMVRQLFEQVASSQSLQETHIFGLAVRTDREDIFMEMDRKLAKYAPAEWTSSHVHFTVFFRVKFYVENVSQLAQPLTKHLFYLQLRKDIMEGRMFCHEDNALNLAALAMQAERSSPTHILRVEDYVPARVVEKLGRQYLESLLASKYRDVLNLTQLEAKSEFLKEAQKLPEYGMLFYRVAKTKHGEPGSVWLGFCVRGLVVFDVHRDVKTATQHCAWRKISNISFANRKFVVELQNKEEPLVFFASTYKQASYLLELSKACHKFHLVWAKKSHHISGEMAPLSPATKSTGVRSGQALAATAVVEYPSRSSSVPEGSTPLGAVRVSLNRGRVESFGFSLAGRTDSDNVYVVKVVAGSVSDGKLLVGDGVQAINGQAVKSYRHMLALLKDCGPQVVVDLQRSPARNSNLPPGESVTVEMCKERGVLGVRIAGGSDKPYGRGLVRIKQVTADTASSRSGSLKEGDIILQVDSLSLLGKTHRQAAETIMSTGECVQLKLHRPSDPYWWKTSPTHYLTETLSPSLPSLSTPPPPTHNMHSTDLAPLEASSSLPPSTLAPDPSETTRECAANRKNIFQVKLMKGKDGFGITLDKSKSGRDGCGVFILSLDQEPAKTCQRLKPGDEVIAVDGKSLIGRTHFECMQALREVQGIGTLTVHSTH